MDTIITDLETGLQAQLSSLVETIREEEEKILRSKEGYLKVQGALEILTVIKQRQQELNDQETKDQLTVAGLD
jgi:hypothetical protein